MENGKTFYTFSVHTFSVRFHQTTEKVGKKEKLSLQDAKKNFFSFFACDKMEIYLLAEEEKIYSNVYDTLIMSLEGKINKQY